MEEAARKKNPKMNVIDGLVRRVRRLVELFNKRWSVERLFNRAKEWLMLDGLRVRGLEQVTIHAALAFMAMLAVVPGSRPGPAVEPHADDQALHCVESAHDRLNAAGWIEWTIDGLLSTRSVSEAGSRKGM